MTTLAALATDLELDADARAEARCALPEGAVLRDVQVGAQGARVTMLQAEVHTYTIDCERYTGRTQGSVTDRVLDLNSILETNLGTAADPALTSRVTAIASAIGANGTETQRRMLRAFILMAGMPDVIQGG